MMFGGAVPRKDRHHAERGDPDQEDSESRNPALATNIHRGHSPRRGTPVESKRLSLWLVQATSSSASTYLRRSSVSKSNT
jgi:hypothetical protein